MKRTRRYVEKSDLQPNQVWLHLHESGPYGYHLVLDSRLSGVQSQLNELEEKVRSLASRPVEILRSSRRQIYKLVLEHLPQGLRRQMIAAVRGELGMRRRTKQL